jgi:branched-chain amino acid transport system permease protein
LATVWLTFLLGPIVVWRINAISGELEFQATHLVKLPLVALFFSLAWRLSLSLRSRGSQAATDQPASSRLGTVWLDRLYALKGRRLWGGLLIVALLALPWYSSPYGLKVATTALIYVTLGLGLNIVVGVSGILHLGYAAFYAVGAYTYALLGYYYGWGFWVCLPLGGLGAALLGLALGLPVRRLSGDYLAIVTLGFGEIVRLLLTNFEFTMGPRGIGDIAPPSFFGLDLGTQVQPFLTSQLGLSLDPDLDLNKAFIYVIALVLVTGTIVVVYRLENSRLGRAWLALREDEIACQAVGINQARAKLTALALGGAFAGLAGVVFAAQISFINPASFTFMESIFILAIVVLGGLGSIPGVILGALVITSLPEFLRGAENYRMLIFGGLMVLVMIFRPQGLIKSQRRLYAPPEAQVPPDV